MGNLVCNWRAFEFRPSSCSRMFASLHLMTPHRTLRTLLSSIVGSLLLQSLFWAQAQGTPSGAEKESAASLKTRSQVAAVVQQTVPQGSPATTNVTPENAIPAGRILRVALDRPLLRLSKLRTGSEIDGQVVRPVYLWDQVLIPQGSKLVVDRTEKQRLQRKPPAGVLDRIERIRSLRFRAPTTYRVFLRPASLTLPGGVKEDLQVSFIRCGEVISLHPKSSDIKLGDSSIKGAAVQEAKAKASQAKDAKKNAEDSWKKHRHPLVTLRLDQPAVFPRSPEAARPMPVPLPNDGIKVPAGTRAKLLLLSKLNASQSKEGESFQARLQEPIQQENRTLLPEGCVFQGHIARVAAPRRLSRAGSMQLVLDSVLLPEGNTQRVVASLSGVETDRHQPTKMDPEGGLKGGNQSKGKAVAAVAVAILVGNLVDEAVSSPIEAVASNAAGNALGPIVGVGTGVIFYLAGRGKDVELLEYTELEITLGRPLSLPSSNGRTASPQPQPDTKENPAARQNE
jgi:hypothetical protein